MNHHRDQNESIAWDRVSPCEHLVQLYESDAALLDSLAEFVAAGLRSGEGVITILTPGHQEALEDRLHGYETLGDFALGAARSRDQYIALDAQETLSLFMVDGWPDQKLFRRVVGQLLERSRAVGWWGGNGRKVRAFGEMVALLWAQGHQRATIRLEHLWHSLCQEERFSLLCAYPTSGFTHDPGAEAEIRSAHTRVIAG